jgi:hypothetical protein
VFDPVGSTSWHNRHLTYFRRLDEILRQSGIVKPVILVLGPGGVTRLASGLLNDAAAAATPRWRKLVGDAARYADQVLRRLPGMPLRSLEPVELHQTLSAPHQLIVVDRSTRILHAVQRDIPDARVLCVDVERKAIGVDVDAAVAFNVICRLEDQAAGMSHLVACIRPGGWLLMDDRSAAAHPAILAGFEHVGPKTYRKLASSGG